MQKFRFRTRVQRLNSLSAEARATLNYQEQLQKFHAQQGHARVSIPIIDKKPIDLYNLKLVVNSYGGCEAIVRSRKWSEVTRKLGFEEKDSSHLAAQVKAAYYKIILPFEKFLAAAKEQVKATGSHNNSPAGIPTSATATNGLTTPGATGALPSFPSRPDSPSPLPSAGLGTSGAANVASSSSAATPEPTAWEKELGLTSEELAALEGTKRRSSRKRTEAGPSTPASGRKLRKAAGTLGAAEHAAANLDLILLPGAEEQVSL